jgi:hypothetical protein
MSNVFLQNETAKLMVLYLIMNSRSMQILNVSTINLTQSDLSAIEARTTKVMGAVGQQRVHEVMEMLVTLNASATAAVPLRFNYI